MRPLAEWVIGWMGSLNEWGHWWMSHWVNGVIEWVKAKWTSHKNDFCLYFFAIWLRGVGCYAFRCFAPFAVNLFNLLPSATKLQRLCFYRRLSVHSGVGVSASVHAGIPSPLSRPPGADTHPRSRHPPGAATPREQTSPRDTTTAADGTHPTGMHSCCRCWL